MSTAVTLVEDSFSLKDRGIFAYLCHTEYGLPKGTLIGRVYCGEYRSAFFTLKYLIDTEYLRMKRYTSTLCDFLRRKRRTNFYTNSGAGK